MQQDTANVAVTIKMSLENAKVCIKFTLLYNINNTKWLGLTAISCIPYVFLIIILFSIFWGQLFNYKRQRNDIFHCLICHQKLWHQMSLCLKNSHNLYFILFCKGNACYRFFSEIISDRASLFYSNRTDLKPFL